MRKEPTLRIPLGILALCLALTIYGLLVAWLVPPLVQSWPGLAQFPVYLIIGLVWIVPLKRYLRWMETGHWR